MTRQGAKDITVEVWDYLAEHPELRRKSDLPPRLWDQICGLANRCALCEVFGSVCEGCPLASAGERCFVEGTAWERWFYSFPGAADVREAAARRIVELTQAWDAREDRSA
jgi:hypothetical protein